MSFDLTGVFALVCCARRDVMTLSKPTDLTPDSVELSILPHSIDRMTGEEVT